MFEQSILTNPATSKPWTMLASLSGELALVSVAILLPLAYTEHLPSFEWKSAALGPPPARPPDPAPVRNQTQPAARSETNPKVFIRPLHRPFADLSRLSQDPATIDAPPANGVEGGVFGQPDGSSPPLPFIAAQPKLPPPAPKSPESAPSGPIRVSIGVQMAKLIRQVKPEYPPLAKAARISGVVHLVGVIGKDGTIQNLQLISGHALLTNAAIEAVRQWRYKPTLLNGEPVEVICPIDVIFTLTQ